MIRFAPALMGGLVAISVLAAPSYSFHKGSQEAAPPTNNEFKEMLRQREIERERSRRKLAERENETVDPKVLVRIHEKGDSPTNGDGSRVVATLEMSPDEVRNRDFNGISAKVRACQESVLGAPAHAAEQSTAPPVPAAAGSGTSNWVTIGFLAFVGAGWWFIRRQGAPVVE